MSDFRAFITVPKYGFVVSIEYFAFLSLFSDFTWRWAISKMTYGTWAELILLVSWKDNIRCPPKWHDLKANMISKPRITWSECYWHQNPVHLGSVAKLIKEYTNVGLLPGLVGSNHQFCFQLVNPEPELGLITRTSCFWNQNRAILKIGLGPGFLVLFMCGTRPIPDLFSKIIIEPRTNRSSSSS